MENSKIPPHSILVPSNIGGIWKGKISLKYFKSIDFNILT